MANITTKNGVVATKPFETTETRAKVSNAFATNAQKAGLTPLEVIFDSQIANAGDIVYVKGEDCKLHFAKNVLELDGTNFILVPESNVILIKTKGE